jgi:hypothetical protein
MILGGEQQEKLMSKSEAPRDDEDVLDVRIRAMTGDELTPRAPVVAPAQAPAYYDEDASIGKLPEDSFHPAAAPPPPLPKAGKKTAPGKPPSGDSWDDMSNLG